VVDDGEQVLESSNDEWRLGARFLLGAEYFPASNIGIHAEYGLTVSSFHRKEEQDFEDGRTRIAEIDQVRFGGDQFLFGVSVYF
jgi:opacity protein-like surface antigen